MRVAMFVYNNCTRDARVFKEATSLVQAGHEVTVFAVLDKQTLPSERRSGFLIVRIDRDPPHYKLLRALRRVARARRLVRARAKRGVRRLDLRASAVARRARHVRGPRRWFLAPIGLVAAAAHRCLAVLQPRTGEPEAPVATPGRPAWHRALLLFHKPLMFLDYYRRGYRAALAGSFELFHAHDLNTLPVAAALSRRTGGRLIYDAHELYPDISTLSRLESRIWRLVERRLIRRADRVLTVCDSIADVLARRYGVSRPTVVLNCPLRLPPSPTRDGVDPLRGPLGLAPDVPVVLYQGGFSPNRGLGTLVLSARLLRAGVVVLMGWGSLEAELRTAIETEGLEERIMLLPPVPQSDVVLACTHATLGVIPYEPRGLNNLFSTPNKLFDFMAAGVPLVGTQMPELTRFIVGCDIGVTVPSGDVARLASGIQDLLDHPARRLLMRENALAASRRYCWDEEQRALLDVYAPETNRSEGTPLSPGVVS